MYRVQSHNNVILRNKGFWIENETGEIKSVYP